MIVSFHGDSELENPLDSETEPNIKHRQTKINTQADKRDSYMPVTTRFAESETFYLHDQRYCASNKQIQVILLIEQNITNNGNRKEKKKSLLSTQLRFGKL